jgi:hypothetical protein
MGVKRWKSRALDRIEWATIVSEGKAVVLKKKNWFNGSNCRGIISVITRYIALSNVNCPITFTVFVSKSERVV